MVICCITLYYGASKGDVSALMGYDIVLTTYETVSNDWGVKTGNTAASCGLISGEWLRVILDEGKTVLVKGALNAAKTVLMDGFAMMLISYGKLISFETDLQNGFEPFTTYKLASAGALPGHQLSTASRT